MFVRTSSPTGGALLLNGKAWLLNSTAGTPTPTPTPSPPATADAVYFDVQPAQDSGPPGTRLLLTLTPRLGPWPSTGDITLTSTLTSTFDPVTVPNGTSTPVTVGYTPLVAGYHLINSTNTLGIKNPGYVGFSAFTFNAGSSVTISQTTAQLAAIKDFSIWQRDCTGGFWDGTFTKGWARCDVPVTLSGAATALWMRLYDAMSSGATATPGTGTLLQDAKQVRGAIPAGASTPSFNFPAGMNYYYIELSTDQAFTNPYRIPKRFGAGHRIGISCRSYLCVLVWGWNYQWPNPSMPNYLTMAGNYGLAADNTNNNAHPAVNDWKLHDGTPGFDTSPGIMEMCRLMSGAMGVLTGMIGSAPNGGDLFFHESGPGTLSTSSNGSGPLYYILGATNGLTKFGHFLLGERDIPFSDENWKRCLGSITDQVNAFAGCPVLMCCVPLDNIHTSAYGTHLIGSTPSAGFGRMLDGVLALERTRRDIVHAAPMTGKFSIGQHDGMIDRVLMGDDIARAFLYRTDPSIGGTGGTSGNVSGPRFVTTGGVRASGSYVIDLPIEFRGGGTSIVGVHASFHTDAAPVPVTTPSSFELANTFTVRLAGEYGGYGRKALSKALTFENQYGVCVAMDATTPAQLINTSPGVSKVRLTLDSTAPGSIKFVDGSVMALTDDLRFSISYGVDVPMGVIKPTNTVYTQIAGYGTEQEDSFWITDNVNPEGLQWGRALQREILYYVNAPVPAAQSVSITTPPYSFFPSGWVELSGPAGTGPRLSGLKFSIDGGAAADPVWLRTRDDNTWSAVLVAPPGIGAHPVSIFRAGISTADDTKTFNVQPLATLLGTGSDFGYMNLSAGARASYIESYSVGNRAGQWTDTGATVHPAAQLSQIARWDGDSGNTANRLGTWTSGVTTFAFPSLDFCTTSTSWRSTATTSTTAFDRVRELAGMVTEPVTGWKGTCAPITAGMAGDFTVVSCHRGFFTTVFSNPWGLMDTPGNRQIGVFANAAAGVYMRGTNSIPGAPNVSIGTLVCYVMRYQVATGQLDLFWAPQNGSSWSSYTNTVAPSSVAPTNLIVQPYGAGFFYLGFFSSAFGGDLTSGDVNAALTHLTNRYG